ncbi:hypothetical protein DSL64_15395 [Dyadobacter luteus]|uniref:Uncharacterized protein n=1 Tax=Dyadobacter luteus TaxID=2259619 RepID=A0A3D8YA76_9BACT|nr:hypothetical protein [Dyadobacter luteus]REA60067.1 hypothetical protein DSL64_15395 [Dyadobacter luteus]
MKRLLLICPILLLAVLGCKKDEAVLDAEIIEAQKVATLQNQFHGKYGIVSSVSNEAVDINMDGVSSTNLFEEIDVLPSEKNYHFDVEVRIYVGNLSAGTAYIFSQAWPEQYIQVENEEWAGGPGLDYHPSLQMSFVRQGTARQFYFSSDRKLLHVLPGEKENPYRWVKPESVVVDPAGRLVIVNKRYLYTKNGVKQVSITSVYERFTKQT